MTALLIIGIVVLIIAFLLLCSVSLHVKYDGEASAEIGYIFLSFSYPKKRKLKKQKISDEQKKEEDKPHKTGTVKKLIDEKGLSGAASELSEALRAIVGGLKTAARHLRVNKFDLFIKVASDDPAKTAVTYGAVCATVYPTLDFLYTHLKFSNNKTNVSVTSDFNSKESNIAFEGRLKLRLWFAALAAAKILAMIIKQKFKEILSKQGYKSEGSKALRYPADKRKQERNDQ